MDAVSFEDLFRVGRDEILARSDRLTLEVVEREGTDVNAMLAAGAAMADEVAAQTLALSAAMFLDSASGDKLRKLVWDRYGIEALSAAPALGSVQFTTTTAAASAFTIPVGTLLSTADGRQYRTLVETVYPAGSTGPVTVAIRSVLAGLDQQAAANTITSMFAPPVGAPTDLAVNNPLATAGAADDETDASLRRRARDFWTSARRGTLGALRAAAEAVAGVKAASVFEGIDYLGRSNGFVFVVISDAFLDALLTTSPTPAAYQTQSQVFAQTVYQGLLDVRPAGTSITVSVARVYLLSVTLALSFATGADVDATTLQARSAIVRYTNNLNPGEPWSVAGAIHALRRVRGLLVTGTEILSPPGSVTPAILEVIRTSLSMVRAVSAVDSLPLQSQSNPDA